MSESTPHTTKLSWRPALDGLRGLAVLAVMLFHFKSRALFGGGSLGVDVFFVLSGFLITTLLLQERLVSGTIDIGRFYIRRAYRLMPAFLVMLLVYLVVAMIFVDFDFTGPMARGKVLQDTFWVVTYRANFIWSSGGVPSPGLNHMWSLAIEEQFYLVWPAALILVMKLDPRGRLIIALTASVALLSAAMPFLLPGASHNRLYYGTDFRLQELMLGAFLAELYCFGLLKPGIVQRPAFRLLLAASSAFLAFEVVALADFPAFLFGGLYAFAALASGVLVIYCAFAEGGPAYRFLTSRALRYVGRRSYALYLWHYPINVWLQWMDPLPQILLSGLLSFAAAELSYQLVERHMAKRRESANRNAAPQDVLVTAAAPRAA